LPIPIDDYPQNEKTRFNHLERIRQHLGFVRCDAPQRERLLNHLTVIAPGLTRSTALRQAAHRWLKQEQIVRPGRTTLRDLLVGAREAALQNAFALLTKDLSPGASERDRFAAGCAGAGCGIAGRRIAVEVAVRAIQDGGAERISGSSSCAARTSLR